VTVLGLGELGLACARALAALGFPVTGWSRTPKAAPGLRALTDLAQALQGAEIVVLLLPLTPETDSLMDAPASPYRRVASPSSTRAAAPSSTTRPSWPPSPQARSATPPSTSSARNPCPPPTPSGPTPHHVTPHVAAETRPASAARVVAENVRRGQVGEPLLHLVDRAAGY
jgi:glyoxylate/hydroxypyruvate reductase A